MSYRGDWSCYQDVVNDVIEGEWSYEKREYLPRVIPGDFPREEEILYAGYDREGYEGSATIIFRRDGVLMEWGDGHCSCNGLEWSGAKPTTEARLQDLLSERERP